MSIGKKKKKKTYTYYYHEQLVLFEGLERGDLTFIADKVKQSRSYINQMSKGKRKITPVVQNLVERLKSFRQEFKEAQI